MGLFSTRNNDGASGLCEPNNTVSKKEFERLAAVAKRHNAEKQAIFTEAGLKYRKAQRPDKAGTN